MATIQHMGLLWDVASPSFWRLDQRHTRNATLDVSFAGDQWILYLAHASGEVSTGRYQSRDSAMAMVADAFKQVGAI